MRLYLFDFDGTLTTRDSLIEVMVFAVGWPTFLIKMPLVGLAFLRLLLNKNWSAGYAKAALLSTYFLHKTRSELEKIGADFCEKSLPKILRPDLLDEAKKARAAGGFVAVVSASCDFWLLPFCEKHGFELICTEIEYVAGRFSGRFSTPNCNREEKAVRVKAHFELSDFEEILAWGNSEGDSAMLGLAQKRFKI